VNFTYKDRRVVSLNLHGIFVWQVLEIGRGSTTRTTTFTHSGRSQQLKREIALGSGQVGPDRRAGSECYPPFERGVGNDRSFRMFVFDAPDYVAVPTTPLTGMIDPVPARSVITHAIPITAISRMFRHCFRVFGLDLVGVAGDMLCFRSALRPEIRLSVARAG
jgi:hypothetical protein